ncbi:hypothetical protein DFP78_12346 [Photobacterium lutimaris]|nr:hypothetical protein DFP78_12346 [Photobacterium lutimaris]
MPIDLCERSIPIGYIVSQFNDCEHKSEYTFTSCSAASSSTLIGSQPQLRGLYPQAVVGIIQITVSNATLVGKLNKGEAKVLLDGDGRWAMGDGRWAMGDGRWAMGDGRWAMHYHRHPHQNTIIETVVSCYATCLWPIAKRHHSPTLILIDNLGLVVIGYTHFLNQSKLGFQPVDVLFFIFQDILEQIA